MRVSHFVIMFAQLLTGPIVHLTYLTVPVPFQINVAHANNHQMTLTVQFQTVMSTIGLITQFFPILNRLFRYLAVIVPVVWNRSEEHTSELQSRGHLVCRLLLEKKKRT